MGNRMNQSGEQKEKQNMLNHWQVITIFLAAYDMLAVTGSYFLALWIRYDLQFSRIRPVFLESWLHFAPFYAIFCLIVFHFMKLYRTIWKFASYTELVRVTLASLITSAVHAAAITLFIHRMPISYYLFGGIIQLFLVLSIRFLYRMMLLLKGKYSPVAQGGRVMMIGAGNAGQMLLREINMASEVSDRVVCIIDDDANTWNRYIDGVPVVGGRDSILENASKYKVDKIYLAIPSATAEERRDILNICKETDCELKNLPGM